jgi:diguanylate cyclase (GGDEF)-like protein
MQDKQDMFSQISSYAQVAQLAEAGKEFLVSQIAVANQKRTTLTCILLDLDHFCAIVKDHGTEIGQSILSACLTRLHENTGADKAISLGRDEFLVIVPVQGVEDAIILAQMLRSQLAATVFAMLGGSTPAAYQIGCTAGVALYPLHAKQPLELLGKAEEGLYLAKQQGRNIAKLPSSANMILKSNYYSIVQLKRLEALARKIGRTESSLLREALELVLRIYDI